jgi:resuscitation-promoting factor RpfB
MIHFMRFGRATCLLAFLLLAGCQPHSPSTIALVDGTQVHMLVTNERVASTILSSAGLFLSPIDELLFNGIEIAHDAPLPAGNVGTLQIRRSVLVTVNGRGIQTANRTIGEALANAGIQLHISDGLAPSSSTVITSAVALDYRPSQELAVESGGQQTQIRSAAGSVGEALAEAGLPLVGLDFSKPGENEPLPADGQIQVVRVSESIILAQKNIPFGHQFKESPDVELGQEQILQPGVDGLVVSRVRIRYEDGQEVSRQSESETIVRPPQDRISARGTKIVLNTATVNGVTFQYWRMLQMYATVYSPCNSGGSHCSSGTASGLPAGKGVVAVDPGLYAYLNGQRLYIPGYGMAVIGDVGGGYIVEQNTGVSRYRWIDLGFDDNNLVDMTGWVTVYFLAPAPASIPDVLK